jgi:hypothetical protein
MLGVSMPIKKFLDLRSFAFGLAGCVAGLLSTLVGGNWLWWLLGFLGAAVAARVVFGRTVRAIAFGAGAIISIVALFLYLFGYPVYDDWKHRARFDPLVWKQGDTGEDIMWPPRLRMVDNLLKTHDLHGWDRSRVVAFLGKPDMTNWNREGQLVYHLGPERGLFRIDSEWLVITLDDNRKVTDYTLARD